jgi:hypothetical protein
MHEILALSIKCYDFKEDLFILYLNNPIEKMTISNNNMPSNTVRRLNKKEKPGILAFKIISQIS